MTSQLGKQTAAIHILPISRSKGNETMTFVQLIECNVRNIFFQKSCRNEVGGLVHDLFSHFKKLSIWSKQMVSTLVLIYLGTPPLGHSKKTNRITFQTADPEIFSILIFYKRVRD